MRCILVLLLLLASPAQAGPWPREVGRVFLALGGQTELSRVDGMLRNFSSIYAEYGLTSRLTAGLDVGGDNGRAEKLIAFLRMPVFESDRATRFAAELGIGQVDNEAALRPGFTLGRGITLGKRSGWVVLDTRLAFFPGGDDPLLEADFTLGVSATDRLKLIAQLQTGRRMGRSATIKFAPSVVYQKNPGHHLEFGVIAGIKDTTAYGFKFNVWREF